MRFFHGIICLPGWIKSICGKNTSVPAGESILPTVAGTGAVPVGCAITEGSAPSFTKIPSFSLGPILGIRQGRGGKAYLLRYSKTGVARFFGQLEIARSFQRAIRRSGLPAAYSHGFHPHMKLSFSGALPLGFESLVEEARLALVGEHDPVWIRQRLNRALPRGLKVEEVAPAPLPEPKPKTWKETYIIEGLSSWEVKSLCQSWAKHREEVLVKKTKRGEVRAKLGEILLDVRPRGDRSLEMDLYEEAQACFRPNAVLQQLLREPLRKFSDCSYARLPWSSWKMTKGDEDVRGAHH